MMGERGSNRSPRLVAGLSALALIAGIALVSPWQMVDPDALSHLAIGRVIVQTGEVPATDPFTYSVPGAPWSNPEWLGDVFWYLIHRAAGDAGQQAFKMIVIAGGWLLVLVLSVKQGSSPLLATALLLLLLPASLGRFTLRNHLHAFWLIPLYCLVIRQVSASVRLRPMLILTALGVLWANLHGSFPLGWVILLAGGLQLVADGAPRRAILATAAILAIHPALALLGPQGAQSYGQIIDHLIGASTYRELILEWRAPDRAPAALAQLSLHLVAVIGLLSFLPRCNRRRVGPFFLFVAAVVLGYTSQRFVPVFAVLAVPQAAANIERWGSQGASRRVWRYGVLALATIAAGLLIPVILAARTDHRAPVLERPGSPVSAARHITRHAARGARLFNPYNAGPWLLWESAPRVKLYIDPRNNLGARLLRRYVRRLLPDPVRFEEEARRLEISLAMTDLTDARMARLNDHLDKSSMWVLVYLDGFFAVHARGAPSALIAAGWSPFRQVRARPGFEHLAGRHVSARALARDAALLKRQSPPLATALEAYRLLCAEGRPPPLLGGAFDRHRSARAGQLLQRALPRLPPSPMRLSYLATALHRQGNRAGCRQVLDQAAQLYPSAPMVIGLRSEVARASGRAAEGKRLHRRLCAGGNAARPVCGILSRSTSGAGR